MEAVTDFSLPARIRAHVAIARIDHWTKNVFVFPGVVVALTAIDGPALDLAFFIRFLLGMLATGLTASSNYVINEVLDAPFDRLHPIKKNRPTAVGLVNIPIAYVQWLALMALAMLVSSQVSRPFLLSMIALWIMGCFYNIRPFRTKDVPYLDVLSESVNNPLRMLAGWYIVTDTFVPPLSLLLSYWMVGCYFMALKRFSEYREINNKGIAASYRKSFKFYTERSLLVSVMFYASTAMLFFGAFIIRYRIELVLAFPFVALVMAEYYRISYEEHSAVQNPEYLHKQRGLMIAVSMCAAIMIGLLVYDIPVLSQLFAPSIPPQR